MNAYTITALIRPNTPAAPLPSKTTLERHRDTHAAGIPEFHLTENRVIALSLHFKSKPDPIDPNLPNQKAQDAALRHLKEEIRAHYPGSQPKFQLYRT